MNRGNRLAYTLNEAIVVCESPIYFGKGRGRQNYIGESSRLSLEEFLHYKEIELAEGLFSTLQMLRQKTARHVHRPYRSAGCLQHLSWAHCPDYPHVVCADTVVEERQRMLQHATLFAG